MDLDVVIIGAGLSGLACALYLAKRDYCVTIFEARSNEEINPAYSSSGRTISMDLSVRGLFALKEIGVGEEILKEAVLMRYKIFHARDGTLTRIPYGRNPDEYIATVSRNHLYRSLLDYCQQHKNINIHFEKELKNIDINGSIVHIRDKNNAQNYSWPTNIVIGADGVNSSVRRCLEHYTGINFSTSHFKQCYKELLIPKELGVRLEHQATHLWSRDEFLLLAQPNPDFSFSLALLMPLSGQTISFANITTDNDIRELFKEHFNDVLIMVPDLCDQYRKNPVSSLRMVSCQQWTYNGNIVLLGDAAHGMVPFFGQGVNCCFEDCTVLNQCLDEANDCWTIALTLFNERRVANGHAISTLSYENYPELHQSRIFDRVLLKKQIDELLSKKYSRTYVSYHQLVCFHRVPYVYAMACKRLQEPLLDALSNGISTVQELDWQKA